MSPFRLNYSLDGSNIGFCIQLVPLNCFHIQIFQPSRFFLQHLAKLSLKLLPYILSVLDILYRPLEGIE